jgi:protein farnesyltransferase/geranylgeranyltransferase type-1 subunit alpha
MISDFLPEPKNYHAWQYRQWILQTFGGPFDAEVRLVDELLRLDVYNNSAWNHRRFVFATMAPLDLVWKDDEISYAQTKLDHDHTNESVLQYLKWLDKQ